MSLRNYIILMILATVACALALLAVIFFFDPNAGGWPIVALFYLSLFLTALGVFALIGLVSRLIFTKDKLVFKKVIASFRQGIWLALLLLVSLYLNRLNILNWQYLIPLILGLAILELFFLSYKPRPGVKI